MEIVIEGGEGEGEEEETHTAVSDMGTDSTHSCFTSLLLYDFLK